MANFIISVGGTNREMTDDEHAAHVKEQEIYAAKKAINGYKWKRENAFPDWRTQLDLLYHDMIADKGNKTGEWFKAVAKVKSDNPKPE